MVTSVAESQIADCRDERAAGSLTTFRRRPPDDALEVLVYLRLSAEWSVRRPLHITSIRSRQRRRRLEAAELGSHVVPDRRAE